MAVTAEQRELAQKELQRRRELAKVELARRAAIRARIIEGLHEKQRDVVETIDSGQRFIALCCSRRAGKTYLLASLIILKLLDAGFNQAVFFVATTMSIGKGLIWREVAKIVEEFDLGWTMREHQGSIETPSGATFRIIGMDSVAQTGKTRGFDIVLCLTDETQEYEHLLAEFLISTSPALTGHKGVFVAAGTPGIAREGIWFDICHGEKGFTSKGWDLRENPGLPRSADEILQEEMTRHGYTWEHATFQREYLGIWKEDHNFLVCEYSTKSAVAALPSGYSKSWKHVIGIDYGFTDDTAWVVIAVDPDTGKKYVVHAEKEAGLDGDQAADRTLGLVTEFGTPKVISDPGGGGLPFFAAFNRKYARSVGITIRPAWKPPGSVEKSIHLLNTELRTGRLLLVTGHAGPLVKEVSKLRWKNNLREEILKGSDYPDHCFDALRYALMDVHGFRVKGGSQEEKAEAEEERLLAKLRSGDSKSDLVNRF